MAISNFSIKNAVDAIKTFMVETVGSDLVEITKVAFGGDDTATRVTSSVGLPTQVISALPTGANVLGKVDVNSALPAGSAVIGKVDLNSALPAGTNNIGDVDLASPIPAGGNLIGSVDLGSVPAASRDKDSTSSYVATDAVMNNFVPLTPKFAKANVTASTTDGAVVAAVASKKIRVLSFRLHTAGTGTNVTFNSKPAGAGTAISELFATGANGGRSEAFSPVGHFETVAGEGLSVTTGAGSTTGIGVTYVEV